MPMMERNAAIVEGISKGTISYALTAGADVKF